jgi:hypothetical protein
MCCNRCGCYVVWLIFRCFMICSMSGTVKTTVVPITPVLVVIATCKCMWKTPKFMRLLLLLLLITFMRGIYNYIPETTHVSMVFSVAAVLYLQSVLHVMLFRPWNMFCTVTLALPAVCVQCPISLFFVVLNFVLSRCVAQILEMVPVAHIITGITFAFTFHMRWISSIRSLYF